MRLNTLKPAPGQKTAPKRLGRGTGSGLGKTCGKGHKGQKARAGGFHKVGFEGGQVPMYRRLPKFGFKSKTRPFVAEIRLHELEKVEGGVITLESLKEFNLIRHDMIDARIIASGEVTKAVVIRGLKVTPGAKAAIEKAGGKVEVINE